MPSHWTGLWSDPRLWPNAPKWCLCTSITRCPHAYCPACMEPTVGTSHRDAGTPAGSRCGQPARAAGYPVEVTHVCGHTKTVHSRRRLGGQILERYRASIGRLPCFECFQKGREP